MKKIKVNERVYQVYTHQEFINALDKRVHDGELEVYTSMVVPGTKKGHTFSVYIDWYGTGEAVYNLDWCLEVNHVYLIKNNQEHGWFVLPNVVYAF